VGVHRGSRGDIYVHYAKGGNFMRLSQQSFETGTGCKRGRGFELRITENKSSKVASAGHGPGTAGLRV